MTTTIALYSDDAHRDQVVTLWNTVFGYETAHNRPDLVIAKKLAVNDQLFFVAIEGSTVIGTVMAGYDGHRGWLYSVAVAPTHRRQGIGTQLITHAERALAAKGCMKINLQIMAGNERVSEFYSALGYTIEPRVSMGKKLPENIPL